MSDLYQQNILDHYKNPRNKGKVKNATHTIAEANQSCGDSFIFYLKISEDYNIEEITFEGEGCAISTAAASLLTQELKGQPFNKIGEIDQAYMEELIGAPVTVARIKCLTLPAVALTKLADQRGGEE